MASKLLGKVKRAVRKKLLGREGAKYHRFLFRSWTALTSIDLAARVTEVEFFRGAVEPQPLPVNRVGSMLVLAPHQDDETIGAGGTMVLANQAGARVDVLYITDGMQLNLPCSPEESVKVRHAEAVRACAVAGAQVHTLGVPNVPPVPTLDHVDELGEVIQRLSPEVLLLPWLLDAPAKHRMVNHLLLLASRRSPLPECEVWGYQVHSGIIPNGVIDITSVFDRKQEMLRAFESQNSHSQCYDHLSAGLSAWNSRFLPAQIGSVQKRYAEVFFAVPLATYLDLTAQFYLKDLAQTYQGNETLLGSMEGLEVQVSK